LGIRARLFLLILLAVVPLAVLEIVRLPRQRAINERLAKREAERVAAVLGSKADVELGKVSTAVSVLTTALIADRESATSNDALLRSAVAATRSVFPVVMALQTVADENVGTSAEPIGDRGTLKAAGRSYFDRALRDTGVVVGEAVVSRRDAIWSVHVARAVHGRDGRTTGVLLAGIRLGDLQKLLGDSLVPAGAVVTVVDQTGRILARSLNHERWVGRQVFNADSQVIAHSGRLPTTITTGIDGGLLMLANHPVQSAPWMLYVGIPLDVAYAEVRRQFNRDLFVGSLTTLLALFLAWLVGGRIAQPVRSLTADARALETGDLSRRSAVATRGEIGALAATFNRMASTLQRRDADLRASETRYRALFHESPFPIVVVDRDTFAILEVNDAAVRLYGWTREEFVRLTARALWQASERRAIEKAFAGSAERDGGERTWRHAAKDGRELLVTISTVRVELHSQPAVLAVIEDVTQRSLAHRELEASREQLRQSQKMDAVGRLAGGIAHDFNNLLTVIGSFSDFLLESLPPGSAEREDVDEIRKATTRAAALTRQLLTFSRQQVIEQQAVDVGATVRELQGMLRRLLGEDVELVTEVPEGLGSVLCDTGQLEQVIVNLAINARDAMPRGGPLVISVANVDVDREFAARRPPLVPGSYVRLSVRDRGVGMTEEVKSQIFEPFFTTKDVGRGTGLGLSTVYGIVRQSGGHIHVESAPQEGSTFEIYLPRLAQPGRARIPSPPHSRALGQGSVLLVEDEPALRVVTERILTMRGYRVILARDGVEALEIALADEGLIDVIVTDVVMPRMSGPEFIERLRSSGRRVPVLFMSGYSDHDAMQQVTLELGDLFLQKPFSAGDLADRLRALVGA
jgi:hypothetical protein